MVIVGLYQMDEYQGDSLTIKGFADQTRRRAIEAYGEAGFAKLCLHFDKQIPAGREEDRLETVLAVLARGRDAKVLQLCLVWLDGHGYSAWNVAVLLNELNAIRRENGL